MANSTITTSGTALASSAVKATTTSAGLASTSAKATTTSLTAAQSSAAAKAALKLLKKKSHENSARYFAYGVAGIIGIFTIIHWTRFVYKRFGSSSKALKGPVAITRTFRKILIRKVPGFPSVGHALVFLAYVAVSLSVLFSNIVSWDDTREFAKRLGWLACCNLFLVVFLSLKHTPLAFLTAFSHERLNSLHAVSGYVAIASSLAHGIVYIELWVKQKKTHELTIMVQRMGYVSGFSMLIIIASVFILQKRRYEIFFLLHFLLAVMIITTSALHRPKIASRSVLIFIIAGGAWGVDRVLRTMKKLFTCLGNSAVITPLPNGGTRIVMKRRLPFAVPGSHTYLTLPRIRALESHPFTLLNANEVVVASFNGFTKALHEYAVKNPGASLLVSLDGPYGTVPDFASFTKVVFIAGGSGASFTAGVAVSLLRKLGNSTKTTIDFTWVMKDEEQLSWFSTELQELSASPLVKFNIHSTGLASTPTTIKESKLSSKPSSEADVDMEKQQATITSSRINGMFNIQHGRPNVTDLITQTVGQSDATDRIAVAACGPDKMMLEIRKSVANNITTSGPALELYSEHFGW